mgnify:CR=1 FL=1
MTIAGSVHFPVDCHLTPGRLMAALAREVEAAGRRGVIRYRRGRLALEGESNRGSSRQRCRRCGDLRADEYVVCGGIWSQSIVRELGIRIPMQAGKGYSLTLDESRRAAARHAPS